MAKRLADIIGENTLRKLANNERWVLARVLGTILYEAHQGTLEGEAREKDSHIKIPSRVYVGEDVPKHVHLPGRDAESPAYWNVLRTLKEIQHELEAMAVKEET